MTEAEWKQAKIGKISGSSLWKVCSKTKKGLYYADREKYMKQLASEILTGELTEFYKSKSMARGNDEELAALSAYEIETNQATQYCGTVFFDHPSIKMFGSSPDAIIPENKKGVELKNRDSDNHLDFLLNPEIPEAAYYQCYCGMMCLEYDSWDYVSHDDRFIKDSHKIKIITLRRDESVVAEIEKEVSAFLAELDIMLNKLGGI